MSKIVKSQEIRKVVLGLALVLMSAVGLRAYDAAAIRGLRRDLRPVRRLSLRAATRCEVGVDGRRLLRTGHRLRFDRV